MRILISAAAAVALLGLSAGLATDADAAKKKAGKCAAVAGQGEAVGQDLAKSNAGMALKEAQGARKGHGKVSYKCKTDGVIWSTCTAAQRTC